MTSPSAAHTGIVAAQDQLGRAIWADAQAQVAAEDWPTSVHAAELMATAEMLVDAGHASWCPACGGVGHVTRGVPYRGSTTEVTLATTTCTRCRGGRLNPYHGCTFQAETPCTCTTRCQVYQPQETPTP